VDKNYTTLCTVFTTYNQQFNKNDYFLNTVYLIQILYLFSIIITTFFTLNFLKQSFVLLLFASSFWQQNIFAMYMYLTIFTAKEMRMMLQLSTAVSCGGTFELGILDWHPAHFSMIVLRHTSSLVLCSLCKVPKHKQTDSKYFWNCIVLPYVGITQDQLHHFSISQMEGLHVHLTFVFLPFGMHLFKESNWIIITN